MKNSRQKRLFEVIHLEQIHIDEDNWTYECNLSASLHCVLKRWKHAYFAKMYPALSLEKILFDFKSSFALPQEILGKKSSEITISKSRKYCMKIITDGDLQKMEEIFQNYVQFKKQANSLIDIYSILIASFNNEGIKTTINFMIMPNIRGSQEKVDTVYDIKGNLDTRFVCPTDFKDFHFGKDSNFIKSDHLNLLIKIDKKIKQNLFEDINKSVQFLKEIKVIDYSLILVFEQYNPSYETCLQNEKYIILSDHLRMKWMIIDYLQQFNGIKKFQKAFKSIFHKDVSSTDHESYAKRLIDFIRVNLELE